MKNNGIKIEKGIPIPKGTSSTGVTSTLRKMKVGNSILVKATHPNKPSAMASYALGKGRFAVRRADDEHYRIWRTK